MPPHISPLGLSLKKVGNDLAKAPSDWKDLRLMGKLTIQNRQVRSPEPPQGPPRERKKQDNMKHSRNQMLWDR